MVEVFKKLFGRKDVPTNGGKKGLSSEGLGVRWTKKFALELTNMEGSPSYQLSHQLTVGSEVGNIVIADPSVSPRHCTFVLQEDVISVLDHGSVGGTFVNGKKIPPGRYIILEETDAIMVGDLGVKIKTKSEATQAGNSDEELAEEIEDEVEDVVEDEAQASNDVKKSRASRLSFLKRWLKPDLASKKNKETPKPKAQKKNNISIAGHSSYATNSLVRVMAVLSDILIAYSIYIILAPFDEFRAFLEDILVLLQENLGVDWAALWNMINQDYAFVTEMLSDLYGFLSSTFNFIPLLILFTIVRSVSTLLFGVSISEAALGVRSHGNKIWKRGGGLIRVLIGLITGPFIIFDLPAIVSRRTIKEFITFTHTYVSSKSLTIFGVILYVPLLVAISLLSPLIQGLELPEPILLSEQVSRRVKVDKPEEATEVVKVKGSSDFLKMSLDYDSKSISLIPSFKFSGQGSKLKYRPALVVYQKDLQRSAEIEVFKTFNLKELLGIGMKGNFFLHERYPEIYNFVYSSAQVNPAFKAKLDAKSDQKFAQEVMEYTKLCFGLSANNALEVMQTQTPLLKGLMDYRSSLLGLVEYKEFDQVDFFKLGNAYFLRFSYLRQKPFDLIIPLMKGEGRVLKVEFDKKESLSVLTNKFYKFSFEGVNWYPEQEQTSQGEALKPLEVLDFFSRLNLKELKIPQDTAQALYGYYYEKSAEVMRGEDPVELEVWKASVSSIFTIMEKMKEAAAKEVSATATTAAEAPTSEVVEGVETAPVESVEDPRLKLFQNFQDLKDAVDNKSKDYFGINESVSI